MSDPVVIMVQVNARMQPMQRSEYFEDPLDDVLDAEDIGEVTGGGTQMTDEPDGIAHCNIEITVPDASPPVLAKIITTLEELGAPKGSKLFVLPDQDPIPFGRVEGMAVFLNGTALPTAVYETSDVNDVIEQCDAALDGIGGWRGYWEGSQETALYFYGSGYDAMAAALAPVLAKHPLCEKARVEQIA